MKKHFLLKISLVVLLFLFLPPAVKTALSDTADNGISNSTPVKTHKKVKKKGKKAKLSKLKVSKNSAGPQDEVSDQTEVSQQSDESVSKKKK